MSLPCSANTDSCFAKNCTRANWGHLRFAFLMSHSTFAPLHLRITHFPEQPDACLLFVFVHTSLCLCVRTRVRVPRTCLSSFSPPLHVCGRSLAPNFERLSPTRPQLCTSPCSLVLLVCIAMSNCPHGPLSRIPVSRQHLHRLLGQSCCCQHGRYTDGRGYREGRETDRLGIDSHRVGHRERGLTSHHLQPSSLALCFCSNDSIEHPLADCSG